VLVLSQQEKEVSLQANHSMRQACKITFLQRLELQHSSAELFGLCQSADMQDNFCTETCSIVLASFYILKIRLWTFQSILRTWTIVASFFIWPAMAVRNSAGQGFACSWANRSTISTFLRSGADPFKP
jgi:hypothetical protein